MEWVYKVFTKILSIDNNELPGSAPLGWLLFSLITVNIGPFVFLLPAVWTVQDFDWYALHFYSTVLKPTAWTGLTSLWPRIVLHRQKIVLNLTNQGGKHLEVIWASPAVKTDVCSPHHRFLNTLTHSMHDKFSRSNCGLHTKLAKSELRRGGVCTNICLCISISLLFAVQKEKSKQCSRYWADLFSFPLPIHSAQVL